MAKRKTTKKTAKKTAGKRKHASSAADGFALPKPPRRTKPAKAKTKAFVDKKGSSWRRENPGERLTVYLPPPLAEELRVRCAIERRSLSDALTEAVAGWVEEGRRLRGSSGK